VGLFSALPLVEVLAFLESVQPFGGPRALLKPGAYTYHSASHSLYRWIDLSTHLSISILIPVHSTPVTWGAFSNHCSFLYSSQYDSYKYHTPNNPNNPNNPTHCATLFIPQTITKPSFGALWNLLPVAAAQHAK
jgi:hypothetical protein